MYNPKLITFEKEPMNEFFEKNKSKLPKDLPENIRKKLLQDSKTLSNYGLTTDDAKDIEKSIKDYKPKKDLSSKAYPNYNEYISYKAPRDVSKWVATVKNLYYLVHNGNDKGAALNKVISGWDEMEKLDFKNWFKFYEERAHKKYSDAAKETPKQTKLAQIGYWTNDHNPGYFVPVHKEQNIGKDIDFAKDPATNEMVQDDEKRSLIEKQRNKIVSRLDSAEKLLRSEDGQTFAGNEFETLMHIIYELKKKIHTVNKKSSSTKLYEDMIVREANILNKKGFVKAAAYLCKIADGVAGDAPKATVPLPSEPANPMTDGGGLPGAVPGQGPGQTSPPTNSPPNPQLPGQIEKPISEGMKSFLDGLSGEEDESTDESNDDDLEVNEAEDWLVEASLTNLDVMIRQFQKNNLDGWIVEAQAAPIANPTPPLKAPTPKPKAAPEADLEVEEQPDNAPGNVPEVSDVNEFDKKLEQAFQGLTINDVIEKVEDISKIFKTREIPRQLSIIDLMLKHLSMANYFPELAEATNKALDSNQYILTRLDNISSALQGSAKTNTIDLKGKNVAPGSPDVEAAKGKLQSDQDKEKARKQMKKQQEDAQIEQGGAKPEPELEVEEDLGGPVQTGTPGAPPTPKPAAPPAV